MTNVVIVDAVRTPIGAFGGALSSLPASHMGALVIKALLARNELAADQVDEVNSPGAGFLFCKSSARREETVSLSAAFGAVAGRRELPAGQLSG